jgi:capsular polysaccharide biosynthesis protein
MKRNGEGESRNSTQWHSGNEPSLREMLSELWCARWLIAIVTLIAALCFGGASGLVAGQYSSTIIISVTPDALSGNRFGQSSLDVAELLAPTNLGGLNISGRAMSAAESLAVLKSETLTESYIQENGLLPILYPKKWDSVRQSWKLPDQASKPTLWEANRYFREYIRTVSSDYLSQLVRMTISWDDPQLAAKWANGLVALANDRLRARALAESERKIAFLNAEAAKTDQVEAKNTIAALIERETQNEQLARGSRNFGLKVVDPAFPSGSPSIPNLPVWAAMGALLGMLSAISFVFVRHSWRGRVRFHRAIPLYPRLWIRTEPLFRPSTLAILGLAFSAAAWFFPEIGGLKRGYDQPALFTVQSIVLIADWWLLIYIGLRSGEIIGQGIPLRVKFAQQMEPLESTRVFVIFTAMTAIGLALTYAKILSSLSLVGALALIAKGSTNGLKESLYEQYSAGVLSLRYLVIYSASLAVYRFLYVKRWDVLYAVNFLLLGASALLSSRLIFVATVLASLFLVLRRSERIRVRPVRVIIGALVVFVILASLNASRNSNYYARDDLYFWGGGASSIISYLSAPFQTSIGTANHIVEISGAAEDTYRDYVDIDETLNTNSSFVHNIETFGILAWPGMAVLTLSAGFLFAGLQGYGRSTLLLPCTAVLYASSELWRLDLFRQGIFLVWLGAGLAVPVVMSLIPKIRVFPHLGQMSR